MKSITSKLSIIILSLLAMAFTFVLGTTSSKAVSDETAAMQCIAQVSNGNFPNPYAGDWNAQPWHQTQKEAILQNWNTLEAIIACAKDKQ